MRSSFFIEDAYVIGKKFGLLTPVIRRGNNKFGHRTWLCECECGGQKLVSGSDLLNNRIISCGCKRNAGGLSMLTHGLSKHPIYKVWSDMIRRCYDQKCKNYKFYGAKGVSVCDEWRCNITNFYEWAIKNGWEKGLSIDRFPNNSGNYEPNNCRWATRHQQDNNRTDNHILTARGITATLTQFSIISGNGVKTIHDRIKRGWDIEEAIFSPPRFDWKKSRVIQN